MEEKSSQPIEIFYCYARLDRTFRDELDAHLAGLHRSHLITSWYDGEIVPGIPWEQEIEKHLNTAHVILLLISADFMKSDYCYSKEMKRAIERHIAQEACVIPILLRPVDFIDAPFSTLQMLPSNALPITRWLDRDEAFKDVTVGIRRVVDSLYSQPIAVFTLDQREDLPQESSPNVQTPKSNGKVSHKHPSKQRELSRREVVGGGIGIAIGSSITWLAFQSYFLFSPKIMHTPAPIGTTFYTYRGHTDKVLALAWSPDSTRIASSSQDATVQVWDAISGNHSFMYHGNFNSVGSVAWSPDGGRIASGDSRGATKEWNAASGNDLFTYPQSTASVEGIDWSPNSSFFALSGNSPDKAADTVRVWDVVTRKLVNTYQGHSAGVLAIAWSPDSTRIVSSSWDTTVQVWEAATGKHILTYSGHSSGVGGLSWSPNGEFIVSSSNNQDHTVQVWEASTGKHIFTYLGHSAAVRGIAWSSDSRWIASGGRSPDNTVQVWEAITGKHIFTYLGHSNSVEAVRWSPNGQYVASGGLDNTVQVWQGI